MKICYKEKRDALTACLNESLPTGWSVIPANAGMHLVVQAPPAVDDRAIARDAKAAGIEVAALSRYYHPLTRIKGQKTMRGLLLGFSGFSKKELEKAARALCRIIAEKSTAEGPSNRTILNCIQ
jgi:GntR family transcriptional regulator/MocR family aminotransferase